MAKRLQVLSGERVGATALLEKLQKSASFTIQRSLSADACAGSVADGSESAPQDSTGCGAESGVASTYATSNPEDVPQLAADRTGVSNADTNDAAVCDATGNDTEAIEEEAARGRTRLVGIAEPAGEIGIDESWADIAEVLLRKILCALLVQLLDCLC